MNRIATSQSGRVGGRGSSPTSCRGLGARTSARCGSSRTRPGNAPASRSSWRRRAPGRRAATSRTGLPQVWPSMQKKLCAPWRCLRIRSGRAGTAPAGGRGRAGRSGRRRGDRWRRSGSGRDGRGRRRRPPAGSPLRGRSPAAVGQRGPEPIQRGRPRPAAPAGRRRAFVTSRRPGRKFGGRESPPSSTAPPTRSPVASGVTTKPWPPKVSWRRRSKASGARVVL